MFKSTLGHKQPENNEGSSSMSSKRMIRIQ